MTSSKESPLAAARGIANKMTELYIGNQRRLASKSSLYPEPPDMIFCYAEIVSISGVLEPIIRDYCGNPKTMYGSPQETRMSRDARSGSSNERYSMKTSSTSTVDVKLQI